MTETKKQTETARLVQATREGDRKAFTQLVRKYQNLAFASACAMLKDPDLAEDAVQEAFLTVYYKLHKLRSIDVFPAWLSAIVRYACLRQLRKLRSKAELDEEMPDEEVDEKSPEQILEEREKRQYIFDAVNTLPGQLREVVFLFYIEEHSQQEVAGYLGISRSTVNNRLYAARKKLKGRMFEMVKDTLRSRKLPDDFPEIIAKIISIQGPIIEALLGPNGASSLFDNWKAAGAKAEDQPRFTVIQRDINGRMRLISDQRDQQVKIGSKITAADPEAKPLSSDKQLADIIAALSPAKKTSPRFLETGIKMVDLMCPLPAHGAIGLFGVQGVGRAILVMELYHRLGKGDGTLSIFYFTSPEEAVNLKGMIDREPNFPPDADGPLETAWLVTSQAADPEFIASVDLLDTGIYFSPLISCRDHYPAIDCLYSSSQMLKAGTVGKDHLDTANRIRDIIAKARQLEYDARFCEYVAIGAYGRARQYYHESKTLKQPDIPEADRIIVSRARKLELFLTQPFFTTESFTNVPGVTVSVRDTIAGCRAILNGDVDDLPEKAFAFTGTIADIRR